MNDPASVLKRWRSALEQWQEESNTPRILTIDAHTAGEPLRIIIDGFTDLAAKPILQHRKFIETNLDQLRTMLMWEPRGHSDMYGCMIVPPDPTQEVVADFGVLFLHNDGYSTMCGHGIIAVVSVAVEIGFVPLDQKEVLILSLIHI